MSLKDTLKNLVVDLIGLAFVAGGGFALVVLKDSLVGAGLAIFGALIISPTRILAALASLKPYLPGFLGGGPKPPQS